MKLKIYAYKNCSTCQKALKYLESRKIPFELVAIVETPPTVGELKTMCDYLEEQGFDFKKLFNTSGIQYRELGISEKIKSGLGKTEALKLLASNGKLIKRPFVLAEKMGAVGFDAKTWDRLFP